MLCGAATFNIFRREVFAFGSLDEINFVQSDALLFREADRRPCRRADCVIGHGLRRTRDLADDIGLPDNQALRPQRQSSGCAEGGERDPFHQIFRRELFLKPGLQFRLGAWQHPGRNFLAAYLK